MKTKHLLLISLTATSLAMGTSQALAVGFLIDSFDVPTTPPANTPLIFTRPGRSGTQIYSGLDIDQVIGGNRQLDFTLTNSGDPAPRAEAEIITGSGNFDGFFNIENRVRTTSRATLQYTDILATGQGNFLSLAGANDKRGIAIDQVSDGIPFSYTLIISDGMQMSTVTKSFDFEGDGSQTTAFFSVDDILGSSMNTGIDLSMVNYIKLVVEGNRGFDLAINQIRGFEIPEPSALLGLLAVLGTGILTVKRKP